MKFICDCCNYDYYFPDKENEEEPKLLKWLDTIEGKKYEKDDELLKPLPESILNQYIKLSHYNLYKENISIKTQKEFEICYDLSSERIVYPIRDELSNLVGCKGRTTLKEVEEEEEYKYFPLYRYPRSKICYGLYKTLPYIKNKKEVIIVESEKSVLKLWGYDYKNSIAIGGLIPTDTQMNKILKLNSGIVFAWDNGLKDEDKEHIRKFLDDYKILVNMTVIYDKWNKLGKKDSPCDIDKETWEFLYNKKFKVN